MTFAAELILASLCQPATLGEIKRQWPALHVRPALRELIAAGAVAEERDEQFKFCGPGAMRYHRHKHFKRRSLWAIENQVGRRPYDA